MQFRQALFYGSATTAGAFSGLLAFAIAKMNGIGGYEGWRWIFILEGLLTVAVAVLAFFIMPDYPDTVKFLTTREKEFVHWRLANDNNLKKNVNDSTNDKRNYQPDFKNFKDEDDISLKESLIRSLKDWQLYLHILVFYSIATPTYSVALSLPSVIKNMNYTSSIAQLMTIPIYVTASISSVIQAYFSDKAANRSLFIGGNLIVVIIGFAMAIAGQETDTPGVIYAGCFIAVISLYSSFSGCIIFCGNNLANSKKRAVGMAVQIGLGNFAGAFASNFYKPGGFTLGHGLSLGFAAMGVVSCIILVIGYQIINKKREQDLNNGKYDEVTDQEFFRMGDKSPYFRYTL